MYHPSILAQYLFIRTQQQLNPIDACADCAAWLRVDAYYLARFLVTMGIDADRLSLIA